jgi:hypothetical protein
MLVKHTAQQDFDIAMQVKASSQNADANLCFSSAAAHKQVIGAHVGETHSAAGFCFSSQQDFVFHLLRRISRVSAQVRYQITDLLQFV